MERIRKSELSKRAIALLAGALLVAGCASEKSHSVSAKSKVSASLLVFSSSRAGSYDIFSKKRDTGKITDLTPSPGDDMNPQVSPDGKDIVFYSDRTGTNQIYRLDLGDPSSVTELTNDGAQNYDPTYTPDGKILYKKDLGTDNGHGDIWVMNSDGSNGRNVTPNTPSSEQWKPAAIDESNISFTTRFTPDKPSSDELFTEDLTTREITQVTSNHVPDWFSAINPASGLMAFVSKEPGSSSDAIFTSRVDGSDRKLLVGSKQLPGDNDDPSWSPDGSEVVFVHGDNTGHYTTVQILDRATGTLHEVDRAPQGEDLGPILIDN